MGVRIYPPHRAIENIIDNIIVISFDFSIESNMLPTYKFVPTHTRSWCFYLEDEALIKKQEGFYVKSARSVIVGPVTMPVTLDYGKKHKSLIVNFKPTGMYRLFGIPLNEMVDSDLDARLVLGKVIDTLLERLMEAKTDDIRNDIIQKFLIRKNQILKSTLPFDLALCELVKHKGNQTMKNVASNACLSLRQFERISKTRIGLSPKFYARITRFSNAYKLKEQLPDISWLVIAHECGYYDQMHLIRDFKFFANSNPSYFKELEIENSVRLRAMDEPFL